MRTTTFKLFTATLAIIFNLGILSAQTTVNWPLDKADTVYVTPASGTGFTAASQTNSNLNLLTWTGYGSTGVQTAERVKGSFETATRSLPLAFDATVYVEYALTAAADYSLLVSQIQMYIAGGGTSSVFAQILYSTDNFATSTSLDAGTTALGSNSATVINNKIFSALSVTVPSSSTLKIRVYPKNTGAASTTKYLISNNVTITFTASPVTGLQNPTISGVTFVGKTIYNNENLDLQVFDVTGNKIISSNKNIDMSSNAKGIYIVKSINGTLKFALK